MENIIGWIALGVGVLVHLIATVVWATRLSTILEMLTKQVDKLSSKIDNMDKEYIDRKEFETEKLSIEKDLNSIWKHIDDLRLLRKQEAMDIKCQHDKDHGS